MSQDVTTEASEHTQILNQLAQQQKLLENKIKQLEEDKMHQTTENVTL